MKNQEPIILENNLPKILDLVISDSKSLEQASTFLILAKKELKALKEDESALIAPLKESLAGIKAKYEPRRTALEAVIADLSTKTSQYQTDLVNSQREAESAIADRIKPGKGNLSLEKGLEKLDSIEKAEKKIDTGVGSMSFVAHDMCELEDLEKLPIEYHQADMVRVRAAMKLGKKLPGVKYWTEQRSRNSRS